MTGAEIHQRTPAYERDSGRILLHAAEWSLLLAFDGRRTLTEAANDAGIPFAKAVALTEKFLAREWIEEQPITLDQYLKRTGATVPTAAGAAATEDVVHHVPKTAAQPQHGPMRLSAVVEFIISHADNALLGQLAAYRVFLRVPHELLQAEEIVTIHLAGDTGLVRNETLQHAIAEAVHEVVRHPLPDSVYAPA